MAQRGFLELNKEVLREYAQIAFEGLSGNILLWDSRAERIFGYSVEDVSQKQVTMLIPTESRETFMRATLGDRSEELRHKWLEIQGIHKNVTVPRLHLEMMFTVTYPSSSSPSSHQDGTGDESGALLVGGKKSGEGGEVTKAHGHVSIYIREKNKTAVQLF